MSKFKYDIVWICQVLGFDFQIKMNSRSFTIDCPFCGKKKKLNVNIEKNTFRCPACEEGGGMLKLYQLCRSLSDTKEAKRELDELYAGNFSGIQKSVKERQEHIKSLPDIVKAAPIEKRDFTYSSLLDHCGLSKRHKLSLIKRGLSIVTIENNMYKSVPQVGLISLGKRLVSEGCEWKGIPGFYLNEEDEIQIRKHKSGIFVPVKDINGKISSMQIRFDEAGDGPKYIWFTTTDLKEGSTVEGINQIHYAGIRKNAIPKKIGITEGPLKADVAYEILGLPFLAIAGVNNIRQLKPALIELKNLGVESIQECFDIDYFTNPNVKKAVDKIHKLIVSIGFKEVTRVSWNRKYKGIDDYALARRRGFKDN